MPYFDLNMDPAFSVNYLDHRTYFSLNSMHEEEDDLFDFLNMDTAIPVVDNYFNNSLSLEENNVSGFLNMDPAIPVFDNNYSDYQNNLLSLDFMDEEDDFFVSIWEGLLSVDDHNSFRAGNIGQDYVVNDDAEYQTLLQNLADRDLGSRRGAPPASESAIKNLENFVIAKNDGAEAMACTICQEILNVAEVAKKLSCKHVYHDQCITTWLHSRNSCPVCRFELPTDDVEYEKKKKRRNLLPDLNL